MRLKDRQSLLSLIFTSTSFEPMKTLINYIKHFWSYSLVNANRIFSKEYLPLEIVVRNLITAHNSNLVGVFECNMNLTYPRKKQRDSALPCYCFYVTTGLQHKSVQDLQHYPLLSISLTNKGYKGMNSLHSTCGLL